MREKRVECPKCKKAMVAGFLLAYGKYEQNRLTNWVEGVAQKSIWTGISLKKKIMLPTVTYRCQRCGFLESYAHG